MKETSVAARMLRTVGAAMAFVAALTTCAPAQAPAQQVQRTTLAEHTQLFSAAEGNLLMYNGPASVLVAGVQSPALVHAAVQEMGSHRDRRLHVIALSADGAAQYGDGGWGARGAVTIAHEHLRTRMARALGADTAAPTRSAMVGYSEVIQIYIPGVAAHAVGQDPGYSDADASVHFHSSELLMLGNIFTADGYPAIDTTQRGDFLGLLGVAKWFAENFGEEAVIIPARGPAQRGRDLREYVAMLEAVRDRVEPLVAGGRTPEEIIAAEPLADLEPRWGHGPVSSAAFLSVVVRSLQAQAAPR